ncbi:MAG: AGE family epimerase/isomerase [Deltaproteobacteria bacterium]|nr:MAG: AGE family epimerase/isomerase [Deltaproteobacteria bacterium]
MGAALDVSRDALRRRLLEGFLPLWRDRGVDRARGGFHNRLDARLAPGPDDSKRLVVHARLVYAFSQAARLGAPDWARDTARHGLAFLREKFRDARHGGYFHRTDLAGAPLDRRKDLYDHAFVLFALAHHARASGDGEALREAATVLDLLEAHLSAPEGFFEAATEQWKPVAATRRQNPHMHLLEACLALAEAGGGARYIELARRLFELLRRRFVDAARGCLLEFFADDLRPHPGPEGRIVEPGHHFEWVWLLHQHARVSGDDAAPGLAERLFAFGQRYGVDPEFGGVYDQIDPDGSVLRDTKRLWPQTEYVKALAARAEADPSPLRFDALRAALAGLLDRYASREHPGFHEETARDGALRSAYMPATSVYHVTFALCEALRVLPR